VVRTAAFVGSSLAALAVSAVIAAPAFAQDSPVVEPEAPPVEAPLAEPPAAEPPAVQPVPAEPPPLPPPPVAQQAAPLASVLDAPGVDFGARVGYGLPFGNVSGATKLGDSVSSVASLVLEAGYRLNADFTIAALFQYGFAQIKDTTPGCGEGNSCSGSIVRLGIEAIYNLNLDAALSPWIGAGTGYEWFTLSASGMGQTTSLHLRGFEFVTLHAGGDYRISPQLALGPFVSLSFAEYATLSIEAPAPAGAPGLTDKKLHEWLQLGVRGRFGI